MTRIVDWDILSSGHLTRGFPRRRGACRAPVISHRHGVRSAAGAVSTHGSIYGISTHRRYWHGRVLSVGRSQSSSAHRNIYTLSTHYLHLWGQSLDRWCCRASCLDTAWEAGRCGVDCICAWRPWCDGTLTRWRRHREDSGKMNNTLTMWMTECCKQCWDTTSAWAPWWSPPRDAWCIAGPGDEQAQTSDVWQCSE